MRSERPFLSHFSPQWTKPEYLEAIFVQRGDLLAESVASVRDSVIAGMPRHLLFVGPRGAGKTHLVTLIQHRLGQDPTLRDRMRVAWLNEDEIATSFFRLLVAIYRSLGDRYPEEFPAATLRALAGKDPLVAQEQLVRDLRQHLNGRIVVCILENLDSLFRSLGAAEQRNWRAFLQSHPVLVTVATAQALFDGIADQDEPFYGFFDTRHLKPLAVEEAHLLLERIATLHGRGDVVEFLRTPMGRARVDAIRAIAGGNPRLYLMFSDLLVNAQALDDLVRPFEELVDRELTSFYQERLRWLSPQQREIVQLLCRSRSPIAVKHIAEGLFTTHNSITGQLKQLRELRYVDSHPVGREVYYELAEPLMRLALHVKETHDRRPLALIVDFLRIWYEENELAARLADCPADAPVRAYLETAHQLLRTEPNLLLELFRRDLEATEPEQCDDTSLAKARSVAEQSGRPEDWIRLVRIRWARQEWEEAIQACTAVIEMESATPANVALALNARSFVYAQLRRIPEAMADFTRAIELPGTPPDQFAIALNNRGYTHAQAGRIEEAMADFTQVIELPGALPEVVAWALRNRGVAHEECGGIPEAVADYSRAIELPGAPAEEVAMALNNRGFARILEGRPLEALADCTRAMEIPGVSPDSVARTLLNRGVVHYLEGKTEEAIADYTHAIKLPGASPDWVAWALFKRGVVHYQAGRTGEAIADYTRAIDLPGATPDLVARALLSRGVSHNESLRIPEAISDYTRAIELPGASPESVAYALVNRGFTHAHTEHVREAIEDYTRAIELPGAAPDQLPFALLARALFREQAKHHEGALQDLRQLLSLTKDKVVRELVASRIQDMASFLVIAAFAVTTDAARWTSLLAEFAGHFARFDGVAHLGEAAVEHLPTLAGSPLNHAAWDAWAQAWEAARAALPETHRDHLDIPLRLLRTGIAWLKSKDDAELLALPREERLILREALGLVPEIQEKS